MECETRPRAGTTRPTRRKVDAANKSACAAAAQGDCPSRHKADLIVTFAPIPTLRLQRRRTRSAKRPQSRWQDKRLVYQI